MDLSVSGRLEFVELVGQSGDSLHAIARGIGWMIRVFPAQRCERIVHCSDLVEEGLGSFRLLTNVGRKLSQSSEAVGARANEGDTICELNTQGGELVECSGADECEG